MSTDKNDERHKQVVGGMAFVGVLLCVVAGILAVAGIWIDPRWGATAFVPGVMGVALIWFSVLAI